MPDENNVTTVEQTSTNQELYVGLVGPIGVDLDAVAEELNVALSYLSYSVRTVRITDVLQQLPSVRNLPGISPVVAGSADVRIHELMSMGNKLCELTGLEDAMARLGVIGVQTERDQGDVHPRKAYVIRQLKRPAEVHSLRRLYGENFVLIAAYSNKESRNAKLRRIIANSENNMDFDQYESRATSLMTRDEGEDIKHGQKLRDTFWRADLFVDPSERSVLAKSIKRFVELLFGIAISTPTRDEAAMFVSWGASMRSASMARQVGATLYEETGSIVATGTNEVPRAFGGVYWEGDDPDGRDHHDSGQDQSDVSRGIMVAQLLDELKEAGWLSGTVSGRSSQDLAHEALGPDGVLRGTRAAGIIEYVRAVHAEQCAIVDAARRGVATNQLLMAVTTFPCHECARIIVAAGIKEVCYVEPYVKSLAKQMYGDSISFEGKEVAKIWFRPYLGVAPQIYSRLFSAAGVERKDDKGKLKVPEAAIARLRLTSQGSPLRIEDAESVFALPLLEPQIPDQEP